MTVTRVALTVPARPDSSIATGSPSRTLARDACGSVAVTRRSFGSNTVTSCRPGWAMSPSSTCVAPTTPANGAVIVVNVCAALACTALALSEST